MNAAYLMLTTAWLAGQTPAPAPQPAPAPAPAQAPAIASAPVVSSAPIGGCSGGGCGGCATDCCDTGRRGGLLSRLCHKGNDCNTCSAPVVHHAAPCCAPAPTYAAAPSCGCGCEEKKPGLFARLHALCHKDKGCGCETASAGCGCGSTGAWTGGSTVPWTGGSAEPIQAAPRPGAPATAPQKMPAAGGTPMTINGVIRDVTPVVAPRFSFEQDGPRQPF